MDEQLDKDLSRRIAEVFDNYEDPSADSGWQALRQKFPAKEEQKPRVIGLWMYAAAAVVLAFLMFGIWFNFKGDKGGEQMAVNPKTKVQVTKSPNNSVSEPGAQPADQSTVDQPGVAEPNQPQLAYQAPSFSRGGRLNTDHSATSEEPVSISQGSRLPAENQLAKNGIVVIPVTDTPKTQDALINAKQGKETPVIAQNTVAENKTNPEKINSVDKMNALFEQERIAQQADKQGKKQDAEVTNKRVVFGVYAGTYFNYAKGSTNEVNVGAGLSSDVRLSKNLKLTTGVSIGRNTLAYNNAPPEKGGGGGLVAAAAPAAATEQVKTSAGFASSVAAMPVFKGFNASLLALDIPLNLKYEFDPKKGDAFISAGLSSGTFVNEQYSSVYNYVSPFSTAQQQEKSETTTESFQNFYFAKTLNLSFGLGYPVGKGNRIVVEPFMKYPLSGMGSQQLKFGSGGVNLKFNFNAGKR